MRKIWLLLGIALLGSLLTVGAIACSSKKKDNGGTKTATATQPAAQSTRPAATETASGTPAAEAYTVEAANGILTDGDGMTLYQFDNDTAGVSNCGSSCSPTWPPLTVTGTPTADEVVTGTLATITRDDGTTQVTYNDKPLYHFSGDSAPGDKKGDGFGGIWHVVSN